MHDENPYRIYRVRGAQGVPELVATTDSKEGVGTALVTLGGEGEFEGCTVGVMHRPEEETGVWLVNPWPATGSNPKRLTVTIASSGKQHLVVTTPTVYGRVTLCGRGAMGWMTSDELVVSRPVCRVCKSAGEQITRTGHGDVAMPVRSR